MSSSNNKPEVPKQMERSAHMKLDGVDYTVSTSTNTFKNGDETYRTSIQGVKGSQIAAVSCMHELPNRGLLDKLSSLDFSDHFKNGSVFVHDKLEKSTTPQLNPDWEIKVSAAMKTAIDKVFEDGKMTKGELKQLINLQNTITECARDGIDQLDSTRLVAMANKIKGSDISRA